MINYVYKDLYDQDSVDKQIKIEFEGGSVSNEELYSESFELTESLCSEKELRFGSCEASILKFKIANVVESLKDKWLSVSEVLNDNADSPFVFGRYKVYSDTPSGDRNYRNIVAYDAMHDIINTNVAAWYEALTFPMSQKEFRDSFFEFLGIEQEIVDLIHDNMVIDKTIEATSISGKDILTSICELNGVFGHINRNGKFEYVALAKSKDYLYPSYELYPSGTVYPINYAISQSIYYSCEYEDFETKFISKLQIKQEENDVGTIVGNGTNCYVIEDNLLVYGKSADEMQEIAEKLYDKIEGINYRPFKAKLKGNPCLVVGDIVKFHTKKKTVDSYILERTLKGIQSLKDTFEAKGTAEYFDKINSVKREIKRLKGKTNVLERSIEETKSKITDVEKNLQTEITQTAESIKTEVSKTYAKQTEVEESVSNLQKQIDGAIETFTGSQVPALSNEPANKWTTTEERDTHIGDLYIVNSDGGNYSGFYYRFEKNSTTYQWVLLKDNEITKALQDAKESNERADAISKDLKDNYSTTVEVESKIEQTAEGINAEVSKKVGNEEIIAKINISPETILILAKHIDVDGVLDVKKLNALGIKAGSVDADNINGETIRGKIIYLDGSYSDLSGSDYERAISLTRLGMVIHSFGPRGDGSGINDTVKTFAMHAETSEEFVYAVPTFNSYVGGFVFKSCFGAAGIPLEIFRLSDQGAFCDKVHANEFYTKVNGEDTKGVTTTITCGNWNLHINNGIITKVNLAG